jgi:predicted RNA binding protein YcfA (HicA-like mRNA interferase family)
VSPETVGDTAQNSIMGMLKVRDLIQMLESAGWRLKKTKGSHRQFLHPEKGLVVTVPGHPGKDIPIGTLKAILRSSGLERKEDE